MNLVIVESPAKAKTINRYLGKDYLVLASYGHVRDLPSKDGSVDPEHDFAMSWETAPEAKKRMREIAKAAKSAGTIYLATDPDREGEAISWHVLELLRQNKALREVPVKRVAFNEITKSAVVDAVAHPRDLDQPLIDAYLARRALDYLVGFTLSPVLWRKLPGARSAGRVQSVALRLICDRELEIESFDRQEYWSIDATFQTPAGAAFEAKLARLDGENLKKFSLADKATADAALARIKTNSFAVGAVDTKPASRHPRPPFTTATLQQEAARKLGFSASRTMRIAQRLYEGVQVNGDTTGLITYMRTDGVQIAREAVQACRGVIREDYGKAYLPDAPRAYKTKAKNAQEAHEAIRPTDLRRRPRAVTQFLDADQFKLYDLIWKRAVASQMESARYLRTTADITTPDRAIGFRANGSTTTFDGFLRLYREGQPDSADDADRELPALKAGEALALEKALANQHFTEPPPRFSEASLVQKLEELGIGRPSTYAAILDVLRTRNYVRMDKNRFVPEDKGRLVTAFLESFFTRYVEYDFTAKLEARLDEISAGRIGWKQVLDDFWRDFTKAVEKTSELKISDVLEALNELLGPHIFPPRADGGDPRGCPQCKDGRLSLKLGKFGAFIGCSNYPSCRYTQQFSGAAANNNDTPEAGPRVLGPDPETGLDITVRVGRFGPYVQLGEGGDGTKPKRAGIPKDMPADTLDLTRALALLALPRTVGTHPDTGKPVTTAIGRYGPYVAHDGKYASLASSDEVFTVGLNRAVTLLAEAAKKGGRRGAQKIRTLGAHPKDGQAIDLMDGRYGPYVKYKTINATLPKGRDPDSIDLDEALALIAAKAARGGSPRKPRGGARKGTRPAAKTARS